MGVVFPPESAYAREMRKHEAWPTFYGPGERPLTFREFPKMLYRAEHVPGSGIEIVERRIVADEQEERNLQSRGFVMGQDKAIESAERQHTEYGRLAAEREWQIQHGRVSEKATSEVRAAEEAHGARHLPDVSETPIKKRGRPAKGAAAAVTAREA